MGWLNFGMGSAKNGLHSLRLRQDSEQIPAIRLEDRLVLGSLSPLPGIPQYAEPQSSSSAAGTLPMLTPAAQTTPTSQTADQAGEADPQQVVNAQYEVEPDHTVQQVNATVPASNLVGTAWENDATEVVADEDTAPQEAPASGVQQTGNTPVTAPQAGTAPQVQETNDAENDAEAAAVTESLQNKSPGVLVDSETMKNGYSSPTPQIPWFDQTSEPVVIHYDFRDQDGVTNELTDEQMEVVVKALDAWTEATNGRITWVRDTESAVGDIVNIGLGDLSAVGLTSSQGGTLGISGSAVKMVDGSQTPIGVIWLDHSEAWENTIGNGDVSGTVDLFTAVAHEAGHIIGVDDNRRDSTDLMFGGYQREHVAADVTAALQNAVFFPLTETTAEGITGYALHSLTTDVDQLSQLEVKTLLDRASAASASNDAIIAIVDRNGTILGVRVEAGVMQQFAGNNEGLIFAIDGAIAKARTAAFFANDAAPLTSRTIQYISQSTVTQREVEGNPNASVTDPTLQGPGYVAPIGLGAHFPPGIRNTPPVDLFGIEHTNRDNLIQPGADGLYGTADDIGRFNIDPAMIPNDPNGTPKNLVAPLSYGSLVDQANPQNYTSRGIATLPGGIPIIRDTDANGSFDKVIGGIGVFFPGEDGYATHEQGFVPGINQTTAQRVNTNRTLEAEYIAFAAVGGSPAAVKAGAGGAVIGDIAGIPPISNIGLPFGNITLVGIALPLFGDVAGVQGVRNLLAFNRNNLTEGSVSGTTNPLLPANFFKDGYEVPSGDLVVRHGSPAPGGLTQADVSQIINSAIDAANVTRAAIRLQANGQPGASARMVIAITDVNGEVLGLFRMDDATVFSIDVAVAKARNVAYYADAAELQAADQIPGIAPGTAFSNRTFRFLAEPRYPDGVDGSTPPPMSILADAAAAGIDPATGENIGGPAAKSVFQSALGYDSFNPGTNFHETKNPNQNGVVFFPGSTPLYKDGVLVGGLGISGDGVDQDDIVTFLAAQGFLPDGVTTTRADQVKFDNVRLPFQKFNRVPFALGS